MVTWMDFTTNVQTKISNGLGEISGKHTGQYI